MKILYLFVCVLIVSFPAGCYAQIWEDFSEETHFPGHLWCGDIDRFSLSGGELHLNSAEAGLAALATLCKSMPDTCEWRCVIKLDFAPSANNCVRYYLTADDCNLNSPSLRGFYLQVGENGSSDALELFYQNGPSSVSVCRGTEQLVATAFRLRLRVLAAHNKWQIFIEDPASGEWLQDAEGVAERNVVDSFYTGLWCRFTSSNISKFSFDDFYVGSLLKDTTPPGLVAVNIDMEMNRLKVGFSERVDSSALISTHYCCEGVFPVKVESAADPRSVYLTFPENFKTRRQYVLQVTNIKDESGNLLPYAEKSFVHYVPMRNDIVISEIMSNPSPPTGLPECEYVELQNRLPFPVNLRNWSLHVGNNPKIMSDYLLDSLERVVVLAQNESDKYPFLERKILVPSLAITNAGQQLSLWDDGGKVVHSVSFSVEWHRHRMKQEGGWSLEMVDLNNPCGEADNWNSSIAALGGTPGLPNSVDESNPDLLPPELMYVTILDSMSLKLFFSETIWPENRCSENLFSIDHGLSVTSASALPPDHKSWVLHLSAPLREHTLYTLQIADTICDCVGNMASYASLNFGLRQAPENGDIVINEILTNPFGTTMADFVELYNRSHKIIELADLLIGTEDARGDIKMTSASSQGCQLLPDQYVVLCRKKGLTENQYYCPYPNRLLQTDNLPDYPQAEGAVLLTDRSYIDIDRFDYSEEMHYVMLKNLDGVSLERIHPQGDTQDAHNWKSASSAVGFATPGYRNSQFSESVSKDDVLTISSSLFSPDGDGYDDYTECCCHFHQSNLQVTLKIMNRQGALIRMLANNVPVGTQDCFLWDGTTDEGLSAPPGLYIVHLSYWGTECKRKTRTKIVGVTYMNRVGQ